jgi:hypothetical protein
VQISAALEPKITRLISVLAAASGTAQPGAPILDGPAIAASMSRAPGIASVSLKNTAPAAVDGTVQIARIGDFLSMQGARKFKFITYEQNKTSGKGKCTISVSLDSGPELLALISSDIAAYLGALMAPLATGEAMTKEEYLLLVGSIYGAGIADEISGARVHAAIDFPGTIKSVQGGTFSGKRAEFAIPLVDILVLEKPLHYEVVW